MSGIGGWSAVGKELIMASEEKMKALDAALGQIEKQY